MISWTELITGITSKNNLRLLNPERLGPVVVWNVTRRCNLNCIHCYFDAEDKEENLNLKTEEAKYFIKDLGGLKVPVLIFSGGEPLLRNDIFELARFALKNGIKTALSTNGTLITERMARKIKCAGFYYVGISVDGVGPVNDEFRREPGAYIRAIEGIRNCKREGLKVGLRFTMTKRNFREIPAIFDLIEDEDIERVCLYHLVYAGRANRLNLEDLSREEKAEALDFIFKKTISFRKKGLNIQIITVDNHADGVYLYLKLKEQDPAQSHRCIRILKRIGGNSSGVNIAAVDSSGNIYPDQFWRNHPLGNLREKSFGEVWYDADNIFLTDLRNRRNFLKGRCQRCNFLSVCNGNFRSRAEAVFKDPWAEDPACYLTEEEINEKWN